MFHLVQFLYQTVLQPVWNMTSSLYDMLSAFFNDDMVLIKLAQACKHVMEFFQNICLREEALVTAPTAGLPCFGCSWGQSNFSIKPNFSQACSPNMGGAFVIAT